MAFTPIAYIAPNYRDFKNEWLKAYEPGTTTPKVMATDSSGSPTVAKLQLNADGFLVSAGAALVIPYIEDAYDLWLFPTEAEADANDTSNAERLADDLTGGLNQAGLDEELINDLSQAYTFKTVALMKASAIVFPVDKELTTTDYDIAGAGGGATYRVAANQAVDGYGDHLLADNKVALIGEADTVDAKQYGIFTGPDIAAAFNAMQDAGIPCLMESGTYQITLPIEIKNNFTSYGGRVVFDCNGLPPSIDAVFCVNESDVIGIDVDCANTASIRAAYSHNLDFLSTRRMIVDVIGRNVINLDNTQPAYGVLLFLSSVPVTATSVKLKMTAEGHNIYATPNGVLGDGGGSTKGVHLTINGTGITADVIVESPRASKVYTVEDGDGIHINDGDNTNLNSDSKYVINNALAWDCAKRGLKIQVPNCTVNSPIINIDLNDGLGTSTVAMQALGVNCVINNPIVFGTNTTSNGDGSTLISAENVTVINPLIKVDSGQNLIRLDAAAKNYKILGGNIFNTESHASTDFSMVLVENGAFGVIDMDRINNSQLTGSAVRYFGTTGEHYLAIRERSKAGTLIRFSSPNVGSKYHIHTSFGECSDSILVAEGDDGDIVINHCDATTTAASCAVLSQPVIFKGHGEMASTTNGILYTGTNKTGREVSGSWNLSATAGTGKGVDFGSAIASKCTGLETTGYATHINIPFSDKCLLTNNLGRGAGTHITATSATNIVNRDNDIIV